MIRFTSSMVSFSKSFYTIFILFTFSISLLLYIYITPNINPPIIYIPISTSTNTSSSSNSTCSAANFAAGPTTLSHILFSLAGSASTWDRRRHYSHLWWTPESTRGFVWLDEPARGLGAWLGASYPPHRVLRFDPSRDHAVSDRIARIVKAAFEESSGGDEHEEVRWFVMGDDDTVFFKENLVTVLSKYDHNRMWYIGGISESVEQNDMHSYGTAFGGGGFAVSYPLACHLAARLDACLPRYAPFYGSDEKISACVAEFGVVLTRESGFHQLDIRRDPYGLLAAHPLAPLVSLHHLGEVDPMFPHQTKEASLATLYQAYRLDPPRTLQHSICYNPTRNWSFSVSWGYTVQLYPSVLSPRELELPLRTFKTWHTWKDGPFEFNTRQVKPDHCDPGRPIVYFLEKAVEINGGNATLSTYKMVVEEKTSCEQSSSYKDAVSVDEIIVVASKMNPANWLTAPQRQCCEISNGNGLGGKRNVQVVVRSCKFGETINA